MSLRILRLQEAGLLRGEWEKWYIPSSSKCMKVNELHGVPRLSLKNLSSPFIILIAGYILSFIVFVLEKIIRFHRALRVEVV